MADTLGGYSNPAPDAGSRYAERRSVPRYRTSAPAEVLEPLAELRISGSVTEISLHGAYVSGAELLPAHAVFQMRIHGDKGMVEAWGRVVYVHPGAGMGVSFLKIEDRGRETLKSWLADLAAASGE